MASNRATIRGALTVLALDAVVTGIICAVSLAIIIAGTALVSRNNLLGMEYVLGVRPRALRLDLDALQEVVERDLEGELDENGEPVDPEHDYRLRTTKVRQAAERAFETGEPFIPPDLEDRRDPWEYAQIASFVSEFTNPVGASSFRPSAIFFSGFLTSLWLWLYLLTQGLGSFFRRYGEGSERWRRRIGNAREHPTVTLFATLLPLYLVLWGLYELIAAVAAWT